MKPNKTSGQKKTVKSYVGSFDMIGGKTAYVTLVDGETETANTCHVGKMYRRGIKLGAKFKCTIVRENGKLHFEFEPLKEEPLTPGMWAAWLKKARKILRN